MTLTDLGQLTDEEKLLFLHHLRRLRALERLEFQSDVAALFDNSEDAKEFKQELVETAYEDDDASRAIALESLTRKR